MNRSPLNDALDTGTRHGPDPDLFDMAFLKAMLEQPRTT